MDTPSVCLFFRLHQPPAMRPDYDFFRMGRDLSHEDRREAGRMIRRLSSQRYLPANRLMLSLIRRHKGRFRAAFSLSGSFLEQAARHAPELLDSFRRLVSTGCVELMGETFSHSLACVFSPGEFRLQVEAHRKKLQELFGVSPTTFCNTGLIHSNGLCAELLSLGFTAALAEGAPGVLGRRSPCALYRPPGKGGLKLILRHAGLSEEMARFGGAEKADSKACAGVFVQKLRKAASGKKAALVGLFMDYRRMESAAGKGRNPGRSPPAFVREFAEDLLSRPGLRFETPAEAAGGRRAFAALDAPYSISCEAPGHDLGAWLGNSLQDAAAHLAYSLEVPVLASGDRKIAEAWRRLLDAELLLFMRGGAKGGAQHPGNPFPSPYDAFVCCCNMLNDLKLRLAGDGKAEAAGK